jgi:hypothetical protein
MPGNERVGAGSGCRGLEAERMRRVYRVEIAAYGKVWAAEQLVFVNLRAEKCGLLILAYSIIQSCSQQRAAEGGVLND